MNKLMKDFEEKKEEGYKEMLAKEQEMLRKAKDTERPDEEECIE
ncbi:MAG: hypothetical protein K0Q73_5804, partial [Paenibacillus sp.]|nr:hypothetical protein [Paenibacillus sp.]